ERLVQLLDGQEGLNSASDSLSRPGWIFNASGNRPDFPKCPPPALLLQINSQGSIKPLKLVQIVVTVFGRGFG
ncbi:hypothetical protein A2U01_0049701, partial [Trifolium medium]|nr:hypothetical protein [Trifolium medium]